MKRLGLFASVSAFALVVGCSSTEEPRPAPAQVPPAESVAGVPQLVDRIDLDSDVSGMGIDSESSTAYVAHPRGQEMSIVDLKTNAVTGTIDLPSYPVEVAVDADNVYVFTVSGLDGDGGELHIVDRGSEEVIASVELGRRPRGLAIDEQSVYVPLRDAGEVIVVDIARRQAAGRPSQDGATLSGIAVDAEARVAYAGDQANNRVLVIENNEVTDTISVDQSPRAVAFDRERKHLYVGGQDGSVTIIDAATQEVLSTISVGGEPQGIAVDGDRAYHLSRSSVVSVIDTESRTVIGTFEVGDQPFGVMVDSATGTVYVPADGGIDIARAEG